MMPQISLIIVDRDTRSRNELGTILKALDNLRILAAVADLQEGMKTILNGNPHIIILDVKEIEQGVKETSFIVSRFPDTTVIVTAAEKNPDWILRLIRAGASEYLIKPVEAADLVGAISKLARLHAQRSGEGSKKGTVISLYNPSGGMGTTTIAVNLAATLAAQQKKVALIDLNLLCGDVAAFLNLTPRYTLTSITGKQEQVDASFLRSVMVPHSSGVQVLNGPMEPGEANKVVPAQLQEVIVLLQSMFAYIVIDTGGALPGCNLATFDYSDYVLFNIVLNLPAIRNAKRYLAAMDYEGIGADRVKLVINRHAPRDEIKVSDAEKVLHTKAFQVVPNAFAEVRASINKGLPLISCYPRSPVAKAMEDLTRQLTV